MDDCQKQIMIDSPNDYVADIFNVYELTHEGTSENSHLITEDKCSESEGLIGKSAFLDIAEEHVRATLRKSFEGTGFTEKDCPWLQHLFRHYNRRSAKYLEHSIHKYLPGTKQAESIDQYIAHLSEKVQRAIAAWLITGQITEVPAEIPRRLMRVAGQEAANQRARMGKGKELDKVTKTRMEAAFSASFGEVKVHVENEGSVFAKELDAEAATIGADIAFAEGKYKPGTPEGDALIAHELAHVLQQQNANESGIMGSGSGSEYEAIEDDAEAATRGVMGRLFGGMKSVVSDLKANAWPRLKSGLQVQRCASEPTPKSYDECITEGQKKYRAKEFTEAADLYEQAEKLAGSDTVKKKKATYKKFMALGNAKLYDEDYDEAISYFEQAKNYASDETEKRYADQDIKQAKQAKLDASNDRQYETPRTRSTPYDDTEIQKLMDYTALLSESGKPEKAADSKEKARKIINGWMKGYAYATMTPKLKAALILELQFGTMTADDKKLVDDFNKQYSADTPGDGTFPEETVHTIFDEVYRNTLPTCSNHKDCITTVRDIVINNLFSGLPEDEQERIKTNIEKHANVKIGGTKENKDDPRNRMQDAMQGLVDSGYAYELLDEAGNAITFAKKSDKLLQNHPTASERIEANMGTETGWFSYGMSVVNGYHSISVFVKRTTTATVYYLADNSSHTTDLEGYYDFEGGIGGVRQLNGGADFDQFVDYANTFWGFDEPNCQTRIWRILSKKHK